MGLNFTHTVEPLYYGHPWDHKKCPDRGVLISEEVLCYVRRWDSRQYPD